jgi:hypothetical protein
MFVNFRHLPTMSMSRIISFLLPLVFPLVTFGQAEVKDRVTLALKTGNAKALAGHFIANIDLTVPGNSDVYSKAQAEQILRKFFDEHVPNDLSIDHEGTSKMGDRYYIGKLATGKGDYRVTFFLKKTGEGFQVKQLRIEEGKGDL